MRGPLASFEQWDVSRSEYKPLDAKPLKTFQKVPQFFLPSDGTGTRWQRTVWQTLGIT